MGQSSTSLEKMAAEDNLTAILYKTDDIRLEQQPVPEPGADQVLLRMDSVGICGSDVHYWTHRAIGDFVVKAPMILGHEAAGVVAKVGSNVQDLEVGDKVAIEPGVPCRKCNFCVDMQFCATPPVHGNLSRYYVHAADFCYKLPPNMSMQEGGCLSWQESLDLWRRTYWSGQPPYCPGHGSL